MNNACKLKNDYRHVHEEDDSVLPILGVWRPGFDCNRLLDALAMYWNAFGALNRAVTRISVSNFL